MMRFIATLVIFVAACGSVRGQIPQSPGQPSSGAPRSQQQGLQPGPRPQSGNQAELRRQPGMRQQAANGGNPTAANQAAEAAPFAPLSAQQEAELNKMLEAWEVQSKRIQRLEAKFVRWHYDISEAPQGTHATWARGEIRYAAPDKGMFKVNELKFFQGMVEGKPQYESIDGTFGEYWVCNGQQLFDFDRSKQVCTIQDIPPEMQGSQIFESPLPFVFNLDAQRIRQRYWVRLGAMPEQGPYLVEAWPKRQEDRAQYRLVQIVIDRKTFLPQGLRLYPPNFDPQTAPNFDHYEFSDVKQNSLIGGLKEFVDKFIEKPDSSWTVIRERWQPPGEKDGAPPLRQATLPGQVPQQ